jgi:putative oxidoreductase
MDWKRLVQFALLGDRDLEQYAILLVRVSIGLFFAISGANKLFVPAARNLFTTRLLSPKFRFPARRLILWRVSSSFADHC